MRLTKAELEAELAHTRKIRDEIREQRDRWEASANASAKAASDNAATANLYRAILMEAFHALGDGWSGRKELTDAEHEAFADVWQRIGDELQLWRRRDSPASTIEIRP